MSTPDNWPEVKGKFKANIDRVQKHIRPEPDDDEELQPLPPPSPKPSKRRNTRRRPSTEGRKTR